MELYVDDPKWQSIKGMVRPDGLKVTVYSTRIFTFATPERVGRWFDAGKIARGCSKVVANDSPLEETYAVIS